jgi:single-stranded DNA-binding protein
MSAFFNNCGVLGREPDFQLVTVENKKRPVCNLWICFDSPVKHENVVCIARQGLYLNVSFWDSWANYAKKHLRAGVRLLIEGELKLARDPNGNEYAHVKGARFAVDASMIKQVVYDESRYETSCIENADKTS